MGPFAAENSPIPVGRSSSVCLQHERPYVSTAVGSKIPWPLSDTVTRLVPGPIRGFWARALPHGPFPLAASMTLMSIRVAAARRLLWRSSVTMVVKSLAVRSAAKSRIDGSMPGFRFSIAVVFVSALLVIGGRAVTVAAGRGVGLGVPEWCSGWRRCSAPRGAEGRRPR